MLSMIDMLPTYDQMVTLDKLCDHYNQNPLTAVINMQSPTLPEGYMVAQISGQYFTVRPDGTCLDRR